MTVVPGDPASLSACAGTTQRLSADLAGLVAGIRADVEALGEQWRGRSSVRVRQHASSLAAATEATALELGRVGRVLQDHSTELAELVARARTISERAAAAGLEVRGAEVVVAYGVTGTADLEQSRTRDQVREELQADLSLVLAQHRRRRDWVLGVLRDSSTTLARLSHGLRQG